jgi:hypothetical protein
MAKYGKLLGEYLGRKIGKYAGSKLGKYTGVHAGRGQHVGHIIGGALGDLSPFKKGGYVLRKRKRRRKSKK